MTDTAKKRPEFRNINAFKDLTTYRMTAAAWTSILHRASGAVMFLLLPLVIWFFDTTVSSEVSFERFTSAISSGLGIVPAWLLKLVSLGLIWGYLHHMFAGIRHLIMDIDHHAVNNQFGKTSGLTAIGLAIVLTLLLGARLFGLY